MALQINIPDYVFINMLYNWKFLGGAKRAMGLEYS